MWSSVAPTVSASAPVGQTFTLSPVSSIVDTLVAQDVIPEQDIARAQAIGRVVERMGAPSQAAFQAIDRALGSTTPLSIRASQFIEHQALTYNKFETVSGLALVVKNTSAYTVQVHVARSCPVSYRIEDESGVVVYDHATSRACRQDRPMTISIGAGSLRVFPVEHKENDYALRTGTYRFRLTLPGYGAASRTVTIRE